MAEFFRINSKAIATPSDISCSAESLDKVERTLDGTMVVDIVGTKRKVDVTWNYMSKEDMTLLSNETKNGVFVQISFRDSISGELITMTARAKGLKYQPHYDWSKSKIMWKGISVSFEEQ